MKYLLFLLTFIHLLNYSTQKAVINVPIADLIGTPMSSLFPNESPESRYHKIPLCAEETLSPYACPRLHQALYNEIVDVIETNDNEACVALSTAFYQTASSSKPHTRYWILKKNITLLDDIASTIAKDHIPHAINFNDTVIADYPNTITLQEPYYCPTLKKTFSAGTRFVCKPSTSHKKSHGTICAYIIDYPSQQEHLIKIPLKKCAPLISTQTQEQQIINYVNLLKSWINKKKECIAYVWGGTSFTDYTPGNFKEVAHIDENHEYSFYEYEKNTSSPKNGFDCSGAILRSTQICGIPYFCKNTTTITQCLKLIEKPTDLSAGDLILIKGHVMIVSDIKNNALIEARSYGHNYGKLQQITLGEVFEGIKTYDDLCDAFFNKNVIKRKDKQGKVRDTFSNLQIFSMKSVWKQK